MKKLIGLLFVLGVALGSTLITQSIPIDTSPDTEYVSSLDAVSSTSVSALVAVSYANAPAELTQDVTADADISIEDLRNYDLLEPETFCFLRANYISRYQHNWKEEQNADNRLCYPKQMSIKRFIPPARSAV